MTDAKHTPEPWHVGAGNGEGSIFADEGRMVLEDGGTTLYPICTVVKMPNHAEEDEANGRLIVMAPEMLKTLELIIKEIDTTPDELWDGLLGIIKIMARKAIAKATEKEAK